MGSGPAFRACGGWWRRIEPHKSGSVHRLNQSGSWQRKHLLQEPVRENSKLEIRNSKNQARWRLIIHFKTPLSGPAIFAQRAMRAKYFEFLISIFEFLF